MTDTHDIKQLAKYQAKVAGRTLLLQYDDKTILKKLNVTEHQFYESVVYHKLAGFVPEYRGIMKVCKVINSDGTVDYMPCSDFKISSNLEVCEFLCIENLLSGFGNHVNIMDLKMGVRQYGKYSRSKKINSKVFKTNTTTTKQYGVRLAGIQLHIDESTPTFYLDKIYGRQLNIFGLENVFFNFLIQRSISSSINEATPVVNMNLLAKYIAQIDTLTDVIATNCDACRFFSSSLLVYHSSNGKTCEECVRKPHQRVNLPNGTKLPLTPPNTKSYSRLLAGNSPLREVDIIPPHDRCSCICRIRLVDFGLATFPGEKHPTFDSEESFTGCDEDLLLGLKTTKTLFEGLQSVLIV